MEESSLRRAPLPSASGASSAALVATRSFAVSDGTWVMKERAQPSSMRERASRRPRPRDCGGGTRGVWMRRAGWGEGGERVGARLEGGGKGRCGSRVVGDTVKVCTRVKVMSASANERCHAIYRQTQPPQTQSRTRVGDLQIEDHLVIEVRDRRAMRADHLVCINLQRGRHVNARIVGEQQRAAELVSSRVVRPPRHDDGAPVGPWRWVVETGRAAGGEWGQQRGAIQ